MQLKMPHKSGRGRSVTKELRTILFEDRRLLVTAVLCAAAAVAIYALLRYFRVFP